MEKSNQNIARTCISFIPRLQRHKFKMVFTAVGVCRILYIKSCPAEMLMPFFNKVQQFMVDYDIQGAVTMGRDNDLFLTLDNFQFMGGFHAHTVSAVDLLDNMVAQFQYSAVVDSPFGDAADEPTMATMSQPQFMVRCVRMLGVRFDQLDKEGGQLFQLRRFVPGPPGTHERNWFYTLNGFDLNTDMTIPLAERTDKDDFVIVSTENPRLRKGSSSGPFASTALTINDFLKLVRVLNLKEDGRQYTIGTPDISGNFWLHQTKAE